jgi:hypothetical protein
VTSTDSTIRPFGSYLVQQIIALACVPGLAMLLALLLKMSPSTWVWLALGTNSRSATIVICLLGIPCGWLFPRSPLSRRVAPWTWVGPVLLFTFVFLSEIHRFGSARTVSSFFTLVPEDDNTLATVFFTLPTWSSVAYSMGASLRRLQSPMGSQ